MKNKNKNQINAPRNEEEQVILPEGYLGEDLFAEEKENQAEQSEKAENKQVEQVKMQEEAAENAVQRDFRGELAALLELYPALQEKLKKGEGLPGEVIAECLKNGTGLRAAYAEYEAKQARAEAEQMRKENEILKQNAAAAAKAPVKGTAAGCGVSNEGKDPFLEGLLSDE